MDDPSGKSQEKARSFLARNAIRRRVEKREQERNASTKSTWAVTLDKQKKQPKSKDRDQIDQIDHEPIVELRLQSPLHLASLGESSSRVLNKQLANIKGIWGVSNATCPNPAQAGRSAFRASNVAPFIQKTIQMFNQAKFSKFDNFEEQKKSQILALTYRGEAMKMARDQLFTNTEISEQKPSSMLHHHDLSTESYFVTILQLVLMDYVFFPAQARAHFAASRDLIRSWAASSLGSSEPTERVPLFIHNNQVNHIVVAFECVHLGPESLIWDRCDIDALQKSLCRFMSRMSEISTPSTDDLTMGNRGMTYKPRIHPDSLVWRSLTKTPGPIPYDIQNCLSESKGQTAAIMLISSIFMDYVNTSMVPEQCVSDLESALISLGDEALASALNLPWMMAGGIGMPIENRRERLYLVLGMQHVFRRQQNPIDDDADLMNRLDNQCEVSEDEVRHACLKFLAATPID